ncbi:MAG: MarR family transcriptional regulator [SAR202 cluster bacterium]|nr:MarR family transcriptional regulator [SAR202 cluster bacterium]
MEAFPVLARWLSRSRPPRPEGVKGPTLAQVQVITYLFQHGPQTMGGLARGLGISCSAVTESVNTLESRGRVLRTRSETDRRKVVAELSPDARAVAERVISQRRVVVEGVLGQLKPSERRAFAKGMELLARNAAASLDETRFTATPSGEESTRANAEAAGA